MKFPSRVSATIYIKNAYNFIIFSANAYNIQHTNGLKPRKDTTLASRALIYLKKKKDSKIMSGYFACTFMLHER